MLFSYKLSQFVRNPTHTKVINLVLTNNESPIFDLSVHHLALQAPQTDHLAVSFKVNTSIIPSHAHPPSYSPNYSKGDFTSMNDYLLGFDFEPVLLSRNVDLACRS